MAKAFEVVHLDPAQLDFERQGDTLSLRLSDGTLYPRVVLRSCFPVTDDRIYLSIRDAALEEQPEIGIVDDWSRLSERAREAIAAELGLHYFVPQITRVYKIKSEFGFLYWTVDTDKGPKEFVMRDSIVHYAREVGEGRWLLIDVNQARYEVPNIAKLDSRSQKLLIRYLLL